MFKKLLVCVDGSEQGQYAADLGADMACRLNARVCLVNVLDLLSAIGPYSLAPDAAPVSEIYIGYAQDEQQTLLQKIGRLYEKAQVPYQLFAELGNPVEHILRVAKKEETDLIIMGSRGLSAWSALLLGSVSEGVVHHAHCPVLIVRGEPKGFHQILMASDGSSDANRALKAGLLLAQSYQASVSVLNVYEPAGLLSVVLGSDPNPVREAEEQRVAEQRFQEVEAGLRGIADEVCYPYSFLKDHVMQERGHPGQNIVRYAEDNQMDLIVLGSRGLGGFQRLLLGSVSTSILHHAPCSVLVVR